MNGQRLISQMAFEFAAIISEGRKPNSEHEEGRAKASKRPELVDLPAPHIKLTKRYLSGPPGSQEPPKEIRAGTISAWDQTRHYTSGVHPVVAARVYEVGAARPGGETNKDSGTVMERFDLFMDDGATCPDGVSRGMVCVAKTSFSLFPLLLAEMRLKIWDFANTEHRLISASTLNRSDFVPTILQACHESRQVALTGYTPVSPSGHGFSLSRSYERRPAGQRLSGRSPHLSHVAPSVSSPRLQNLKADEGMSKEQVKTTGMEKIRLPLKTFCQNARL
ncbi:hypothetical protein V500_11228 [Pseudogymnoascus sp. VKM F-4518 (FW-2643)]|nr:hypothetical protein V500_11228 [Pseudogymnoascus sp. VKM F-4518 (FW-2643)]